VVKGVAKPNRSGYYGSGGGNNKPLLNGPVLGTSTNPSVAVATSAVAAVTTTIAQTTATHKPASLDSHTVAADAAVVVASPSLPNGDLAQSTLALTPPTSPGKRDKSFPATTGNSAASTTVPTKTTKGQQQPLPSASSSSVPNEVAATPPSSNPVSKTTPASSAAPSTASSATAPPCVSYAKMAEQNKDRLEQMAREAKERELEQERERRRNAQTSECCSLLPL